MNISTEHCEIKARDLYISYYGMNKLLNESLEYYHKAVLDERIFNLG